MAKPFSKLFKFVDKKISGGILAIANAKLLKQHKGPCPLPSCHELDGSFVRDKCVLITGGNSLQGKATALALGKLGAKRIILGCRNVEAGEMAAKELAEKLDLFLARQKADCDRVNVEEFDLEQWDGSVDQECAPTQFNVRMLDLASLDSVWDFSESIAQNETELHILVNNARFAYFLNYIGAGFIFMPQTFSTFGPSAQPYYTRDGNEITFQTNYLSHFLLTLNLLELLSHSAPARIINVAASHASTRMVCPRGFRIDDPNFVRSSGQYSALKAFAQSKLAVCLFTHALQKRLQELSPHCDSELPEVDPNRISVFAVDPGVIRPKSLVQLPFPVQTLAEPLLKAMFRLPGEQVAFCASKPDIDLWSGKYIQNNRVVNPGRIVNDEMAEKLWALSKELTERRGHYPSSLAQYPHFFM